MAAHDLPLPGTLPPPVESGVFVSDDPIHEAAFDSVTLVVYGWHNVEPGTLSWVFRSAREALAAVRAMKNAVKWAIVAGTVPFTGANQLEEPVGESSAVDQARTNGSVLIEQPG